MSAPLTTHQSIDISQEAVERMADFMELSGEPFAESANVLDRGADILRALRAALTEAQSAYATSLAALDAEYQEALRLNRNAAKVIEDQTQSLTASEKDAEELRWLKAHPDEFSSAVSDAYAMWDPCDDRRSGDFTTLVSDEIRHQRAKWSMT